MAVAVKQTRDVEHQAALVLARIELRQKRGEAPLHRQGRRAVRRIQLRPECGRADRLRIRFVSGNLPGIGGSDQLNVPRRRRHGQGSGRLTLEAVEDTHLPGALRRGPLRHDLQHRRWDAELILEELTDRISALRRERRTAGRAGIVVPFDHQPLSLIRRALAVQLVARLKQQADPFQRQRRLLGLELNRSTERDLRTIGVGENLAALGKRLFEIRERLIDTPQRGVQIVDELANLDEPALDLLQIGSKAVEVALRSADGALDGR
jgi:hypothetical protein